MVYVCASMFSMGASRKALVGGVIYRTKTSFANIHYFYGMYCVG